jgi:hypothetical protein
LPHIRLRGLDSQTVEKLSSTLVPNLSKIVGSPQDHFTFELVETQFFSAGKVVAGNPFVEVLWFPRSQEIQDACAKVITESLRRLVSDLDITIIFVELSKNGYYENGNHF